MNETTAGDITDDELGRLLADLRDIAAMVERLLRQRAPARTRRTGARDLHSA